MKLYPSKELIFLVLKKAEGIEDLREGDCFFWGNGRAEANITFWTVQRKKCVRFLKIIKGRGVDKSSLASELKHWKYRVYYKFPRSIL